MSRLWKKYQKEIIPEMKKNLGYKNDLAIPKILKVTLNIGTGQGMKDEKFLEMVVNTLKRITGQKPITTSAKKSISEFKIRKGLSVGVKVTLRGRRMYEFIDKLINVALPRVRDFRGLKPESIDDQGNLNIGFDEHIAFPEIKVEEVERLHGLEVAISTNAKNRKEGLTLLKLLGFPFAKGEK
ncbi:MAG: hypothetical protein ACD_12C00489G0001 [uncultured bacterium]|nr:MAG: hypothetical protein ACD_12C00489G0001 [uncultured bacterium]